MEKRNTLLIIDDLEMNRELIGNLFKKKYEIVEACDGDEALEYMRENSSKIITILLDLVMPKVNGIEVLKTMRREKIAEDIPVFIITADNSEETMYEAYELGVKDVLEKPFVPYFLKKRIENVIELYKVKRNQEHIIEEKIKNIKQLNYNITELLSLVIESKENKLEKEHIKNLKKLTAKLLQDFKEENYIITDENTKLISEITDEILSKKRS